MADLLEIIKKVSKVQNEISQIFETYFKESFSTQWKIGQNALIQSNFFEPAINTKRDTVEDLDIGIEQKDNKIDFLEKKIGLPVYKVIEEMNRQELSKMSSKRKSDRNMDRINSFVNNHDYIKNKRQYN